ncbi:MAG: hypothetical protein L3K09_07130 [Thermoplasmata archaeon]|nr:hypothetical protein [Thermoplasmata archaeon]
MSLLDALRTFALEPPLGLVLGALGVCAAGFAALRLGAEPHAPVRPEATPNTDDDLVSRTAHALDREDYAVIVSSLTERLSLWTYRNHGVPLDAVPGRLSEWFSRSPKQLSGVRRLRDRLYGAASRAFHLESAWWPRWDFYRPLSTSRQRLLGELASLASSVDEMTRGAAA